LKGLAKYLKSVGKTHIITSAVEHKSVLAPLEALHEDGFEVSVLPVKPCGMLEADMIAAQLKVETGLVSVQAVNNEIGTIQPLSEIAAMLSGRGILFHTDAAQALGKIDINVDKWGVDFATFSAHKVYGPQGVGATFIKASRMELLAPLLSGGGQEFGLRSGTLPVALCAAFGGACSLIETRRTYVQALRERLLAGIKPLKPIIYGHKFPQWNAPGILCLGLIGIDNETLVMALPGLAFGVGAACSRNGNHHSHVIEAITSSQQAATESIRLSFDRYTTEEEIDECSAQIRDAVQNIRQMNGA
jgi:cysteine desulfurase